MTNNFISTSAGVEVNRKSIQNNFNLHTRAHQNNFRVDTSFFHGLNFLTQNFISKYV
jgi:hypothetical protein